MQTTPLLSQEIRTRLHLYERSQAFAQASADLAKAIGESVNNPADAIRLLLPLVSWQPPTLPGTGPLHRAMQQAAIAFASNLRASAAAQLGRAAMSYQPSSYQDAHSVRLTVCRAIDGEATRAADAGLDATYAALRSLKWAVALDLFVRGADLAWLVEVHRPQSNPSLAEAWTLYQDTSREPQLLRSAHAMHPLFMPHEFAALSR